MIIGGGECGKKSGQAGVETSICIALFIGKLGSN